MKALLFLGVLPEPKATTAVVAEGNASSSAGVTAAPLTIQENKRRRTDPTVAAAPAAVWKPEFKVGRRFVTEADQATANAEVSLALAQGTMLPGDMFHHANLGDEELAKSTIQSSVVTSQKLCVVMERLREKDAALVHANSIVASLTNQVKELKRDLATATKIIDAARLAEAEAKSARAHADGKLMETEEKLRTASARKSVGDFFKNGYDDEAEKYVRQLLAALWEMWFKASMDKACKDGFMAALKALNLPADSPLYTKAIEYPDWWSAHAEKLRDTFLTRCMAMIPRNIPDSWGHHGRSGLRIPQTSGVRSAAASPPP